MSAPRVIPKTAIMRRYQDLREMAQKKRLEKAKWLVDHPKELASEFAASVARFARYTNVDEDFYPKRPPRLPVEAPKELKRTIDLALRLEMAQQRILPVDARNRLIEHRAGPNVIAVPAPALGFDYVDRELLVQRTTSPAQWDDQTHNIGGVRLDLLLADVADRTPIVAELKLPGDMDPFFALVQALTCAAHLATSNQYERMRRRLFRGKFPELNDSPRLDVWVLSVDSPDHQAGQPPKGRYMADLESAAETLAPLLLAQDGISRSIRRIAGLGMKLSESGAVLSEVRWAWARTGT